MMLTCLIWEFNDSTLQKLSLWKVLGWPGDGDCHIMHRMQSGGWPYSEVGRDSSKTPSLRVAVLHAAVFRSLRSNRNRRACTHWLLCPANCPLARKRLSLYCITAFNPKCPLTAETRIKGVQLLQLTSTNLFWPGRLPMSSSASESSLQQNKYIGVYPLQRSNFQLLPRTQPH